MKAMDFETENSIAAVFGLIGGCLAYLHVPGWLLGISWGWVFENFLGLCWACTVAFVTGAMGWLGKRWIEKRMLKKQKNKL